MDSARRRREGSRRVVDEQREARIRRNSDGIRFTHSPQSTRYSLTPPASGASDEPAGMSPMRVSSRVSKRSRLQYGSLP